MLTSRNSHDKAGKPLSTRDTFNRFLAKEWGQGGEGRGGIFAVVRTLVREKTWKESQQFS